MPVCCWRRPWEGARKVLPLTGERRLTPAEFRSYNMLIERRQRREPVSRILGRREFWSLDLAIAPATLDPRPDSETLVEALLERDRRSRPAPARARSRHRQRQPAAGRPVGIAWRLGCRARPGHAARDCRRRAQRRCAGVWRQRTAFVAGDWAAALTGALGSHPLQSALYPAQPISTVWRRKFPRISSRAAPSMAGSTASRPTVESFPKSRASWPATARRPWSSAPDRPQRFPVWHGIWRWNRLILCDGSGGNPSVACCSAGGARAGKDRGSEKKVVGIVRSL